MLYFLDKSVKFIIKWALICFLVTAAICLLFFDYTSNFILGLCIGTFISVFKYLTSVININNLLNSRNIPRVERLAVNNILSFVIVFLGIYIFFDKIQNIELKTVLGMFLGVAYIPLVITMAGALHSKYIIRNKI